MAELLQIPIVFDESSFKIRTTLEGITLIMKFDWSTRQERWCLSIFDGDENPLIMSLPLHIDSEILSRFEITGLPPGKLTLYDTTGKHQEAGRDDLGDRCLLLYLEAV